MKLSDKLLSRVKLVADVDAGPGSPPSKQGGLVLLGSELAISQSHGSMRPALLKNAPIRLASADVSVRWPTRPFNQTTCHRWMRASGWSGWIQHARLADCLAASIGLLGIGLLSSWCTSCPLASRPA